MTNEILFIFLAASAVSFIGSLQLGPVNMRVIQTSWHSNYRSALLVAAGGVFPELIYASLAAWFSAWFLNATILFRIIQAACIPFFLLSGCYMILKRQKPEQQHYHPGMNLVLKGFLAGFMNPMLFTFWLLVINVPAARKLLAVNGLMGQIAFAGGAAFGAFLLLMLFAHVTHKKKSLLNHLLSGKVDKLTGWVFVIFALTALFRLVNQ